MKALSALSLVLLSASAHAFVPKSIHCKEIGSGIDNGYEAIFTKDLSRAAISVQTIAGPRDLALLKCSTEPGVVNCSETEKRDTGYGLSMVTNAEGALEARLYRLNAKGDQKITDLACKHLNPAN